MARVNSGINPRYLSDQHLIAESVEITMITGSLRKNGYQIKGQVPEEYCLGKGHMNFFKDKILYLHYRLIEVNKELSLRGIKNSTRVNFREFPSELTYSWIPKFRDSELVRKRISERLITPLKAKPGFHKYYGKSIDDMEDFTNKIINHTLFWV